MQGSKHSTSSDDDMRPKIGRIDGGYIDWTLDDVKLLMQ